MISDALRPVHEALIKEAFLGLMGRVGKVIVKNPLQTVNQGFNISDSAGRAGKISDAVSGGHNLAAMASAPKALTM